MKAATMTMPLLENSQSAGNLPATDSAMIASANSLLSQLNLFLVRRSDGYYRKIVKGSNRASLNY
jgi:hypothetical protein